eukprot:1195515-Prorocentrum_minimum.AAC.6
MIIKSTIVLRLPTRRSLRPVKGPEPRPLRRAGSIAERRNAKGAVDWSRRIRVRAAGRGKTPRRAD